jgi:3-methyladenine DNA glycosylase AlkD
LDRFEVTPAKQRAARSSDPTIERLLARLKKLGSAENRAGMARYAIPSEHAFGVRADQIRALARQSGRDHERALALWETGWHEARILACLIADPQQLTSRQMDAWCRQFDNWATCDSACFHLFDRSPLAWGKVKSWSTRRREFERRAGFALLASLAVHDKQEPDERFVISLGWIEAAADDERNFVKKAVNWALRSIGKRNPRLHQAALATATALADQPSKSARWIGKDALRELKNQTVVQRIVAAEQKRTAAAAKRRAPRSRTQSG